MCGRPMEPVPVVGWICVNESQHQDLEQVGRTVRLRNGACVRLRPIRPDDAGRLIDLYDRLSIETAINRFFTWWNHLPVSYARFFANVDYRDRFALVAEPCGDETKLVAVARYDRLPPGNRAEVAVLVEDGWQSMGLGTLLLRSLLALGYGRGIRLFRADVLAANRRMLRLLARHTQVVGRTTESGVTEVEFLPIYNAGL
jgi:RimJ/RimL family protein N-acetyltransferase